MGLVTDFILADRDELASTFRGWLLVSDEPVVKSSRNPFTGEEQSIPEWIPTQPIGEDEPTDAIEIDHLPHRSFKRIDNVKLSKLAALITGMTLDQSSAELSKPALLHPTSEEVGIDKLPEALVRALASSSDHELEDAAARWQQTDELQADGFRVSDAVAVLKGLRELAARRREGQHVYLCWSL